jgi:hypothetical protein
MGGAEYDETTKEGFPPVGLLERWLELETLAPPDEPPAAERATDDEPPSPPADPVLLCEDEPAQAASIIRVIGAQRRTRACFM